MEDETQEVGLEAATRRKQRLKSMRLHVNLVDEIERGLMRALAAYREHAEEALAKHLVDMETVEANHELEMMKLRAENSRLREALGIKSNTENCLPQTVLFKPAAISREIVPSKRSSIKSRTSVSSSASKIFDGPSTARKTSFMENAFMAPPKVAKQVSQAGGAWQHFVAWVPNGAFLKSADPWVPLAPDYQMPKLHDAPPLPGMLPPEAEKAIERTRTTEKSLDDPDSSDSDREGEDQQPFTVLQAWKASQRQLENLKKNGVASELRSRGDSSGSLESSQPETEDDTFQQLDTPRHCFIVHPHSNKRMAWDVGSLIMVVYDVIMIPLGFFALPYNLFLTIMVWTTRLFWTIDMGWSVSTAVVMADGKIDYSFRYILKRYLRTWFAFDLLIVSLDWLEVIFQSSSIMGFGKLARGFRITRVMRLLRLVRVQEVMRMLIERIQSDRLSFVVWCTKLMTCVLVSSHIIACLWWAVGIHEEFYGDSWIKASGYIGMEVGHQYLVSLHWALQQFSGGTDGIVPVTSLERFFSVGALSSAFVAALCMSSILTSGMTQQILVTGATMRQLAVLRKYLKQNKVGSNLMVQVQRSVQNADEEDLPPESVELLALVPEHLRVEISFQIFSHVTKAHPFFCDYCTTDPNTMRRICHLAMSMLLLDKGDIIFTMGEAPPKPKMYFVTTGLLEYCTHRSAVQVGERQWLSEANLWTTWKHRGMCAATTRGKVAALDSLAFQEIVRKFKGLAGFDCRLYASEFVDLLNKSPNADDLTCMVV